MAEQNPGSGEDDRPETQEGVPAGTLNVTPEDRNPDAGAGIPDADGEWVDVEVAADSEVISRPSEEGGSTARLDGK